MPRCALSDKRLRGHAETPFIVGFGSLLFGLLWATIFVAKHAEYALYFKVLIFIVSPIVGLLFVVALIAVILMAGFAGEWLDKQIAKSRRSRKS